MLAVTSSELSEVLSILGELEATAFGSRVAGSAQRFSDLDLCVLSPITLAALSELREAFEESDLPFVVDLSRWEDLAPPFRETVLRQGVPVKGG